MQIENTKDLKTALREGPYAWPGGYPVYFITSDGAALSFAAVRSEYRQILRAIKDHDNRSGWHVCACDINWEEAHLYCDHTGDHIPSAYSEDEEE